MNKLKLRQTGFTIVELLIVIVIIGILATIGFVAFSGAQNKAKKSKAQSTLSQVKAKLGEYNAENDSYPADKAAVITYLKSASGGNNTALGNSLDSTTTPPGEMSAITYSCTGTPCTAFTLTAPGSMWGTSTESIAVTN